MNRVGDIEGLTADLSGSTEKKKLSPKIVFALIKHKLYKEHGYTMINFHGTYGNYQMDMIFYNVTPSGNLKVGNVISTYPGGKPHEVKIKIAQLTFDRYTGQPYWWIEDGTGSLVLRLER